MTGQPGLTIGTGEVLHLAEADYCYGHGPLTIRVTRSGADPALLPGLEWVRVAGVEVSADGRVGPERQVLVRVAALRRAENRAR